MLVWQWRAAKSSRRLPGGYQGRSYFICISTLPNWRGGGCGKMLMLKLIPPIFSSRVRFSLYQPILFLYFLAYLLHKYCPCFWNCIYYFNNLLGAWQTVFRINAMITNAIQNFFPFFTFVESWILSLVLLHHSIFVD